MLDKVFHWLTRNGVVILSIYIGPNKQTDYNTITNNIITGIKNRNDFIIYDESLVTSDTQPELQWNIYVIGIDRDWLVFCLIAEQDKRIDQLAACSILCLCIIRSFRTNPHSSSSLSTVDKEDPPSIGYRSTRSFLHPLFPSYYILKHRGIFPVLKSICIKPASYVLLSRAVSLSEMCSTCS